MSYVTSHDIKRELEPNPTWYLLYHNIKLKYVFCPFCRKLTDLSYRKTITNEPIVCSHCHKVLPSMDGATSVTADAYNKQNELRYHVNDVISSVTINHTKRDDGTWKDVNCTVLTHDYQFRASDMQRTSFTKYRRVTCNFDNNQIYFTTKQQGYEELKFEHLLNHISSLAECDDYRVSGQDVLGIAIYPLIQEVMAYYNCFSDVELKAMNRSTCAYRSSYILLFLYLKFPVAMQPMHASVLDVYNSITPTGLSFADIYITTNMMYWVCNHDKQLRNVLTARTFADYHRGYLRFAEQFSYFPGDVLKPLSDRKYHPLLLVFLRFMRQLGFQNLDSPIAVFDYIHDQISYQDSCSIWVYELLHKRNHTRKKFYKRLIAALGEDEVLCQLIGSQFQAVYAEYYDKYTLSWRGDMAAFWTYAECHIDELNYKAGLDAQFLPFLP